MPQLITKDGQRIEVNEEQIRQALASGSWWGFDEAPQIAIVDPKSGTTFGREFTPQAMQDAFAQGFKLETPEEETKRFRAEKYGTGAESAIKAGLLGAARGVTLGASDKLLADTGIVDPRTMGALREERGGISLGAELAGAVLPSLVAPGAGAAELAGGGAKVAAEKGLAAGAKKALASSPVSLLSRGAQGIEKAVAKKLGGGKAAELAGSVIGTGAEGAGFGLGTAVSDSVIEDKPLWSESTMAEVGLGGLIGGAFGGTLKGLGMLTGKAKETLAARAFERKMKADPGLYEKVAAMATGVEPAKIAQFTRGANAAANRKIAMTADDQVEKLAREYADEYTKLRNSFDKVSANHRELKSDQMKFKVKIGNEEETKAAVRNLLADGPEGATEGVLHQMFRAMDSKESRGLYGFRAQVREALQSVKNRMSAVRKAEAEIVPGELSASLNNKLFMELDNFKKDLGRLRKKMGRVRDPRGKDYDAMDRFESAYENVRKTLEDEALWGEAAISQKKINGPFSDWLSVEDAKVRGKLKYRLSRQVETKDWEGVYKGDPGEAKRFLSEINAPKSDLDLEHYVTSLERQKSLIEAHEINYNLGAASEDAITAKKSIDRLKAIQEESQSITRLRDDLKEINSKGMQGGVMGGLGGYALGGPVGAVIGAGVTQPGKVIEAKAVMDRFQGLRNIQTGVKREIDRGLKAFMNPVTKAGRTAVVATVQKTKAEKRTEYRRAKEGLDAINMNPVAIQDKIHNRLAGVAQADPELLDHLGITASRAVDYLTSTLPPQLASSLPGIIEPDLDDVPEYEMARWLQRLETVNNPKTALADMAKGELTMEQVETLRAVYPALYQQMQQSALEMIAADPKAMNYSQKAQMSTLLQIPLDPSMTPDGVMGLQARSGIAAQQDAQQGKQAQATVKNAHRLTRSDDEQSSSDRISAKK